MIKLNIILINVHWYLYNQNIKKLWTTKFEDIRSNPSTWPPTKSHSTNRRGGATCDRRRFLHTPTAFRLPPRASTFSKPINIRHVSPNFLNSKHHLFYTTKFNNTLLSLSLSTNCLIKWLSWSLHGSRTAMTTWQRCVEKAVVATTTIRTMIMLPQRNLIFGQII